jgi:queuine tRNA-ribosyltransferase
MSREVVARTAPFLPEDRPRYLMGMGTPGDLVEMVAHGIDLFDCVLPTRNARNGALYTSTGRIQIKRREFTDDPAPVDEACACPACRHYSRAYLRHLFMAGEILGLRLNTLHNLHQYAALMGEIRRAIEAGRYAEFVDAFRARWSDRRGDGAAGGPDAETGRAGVARGEIE